MSPLRTSAFVRSLLVPWHALLGAGIVAVLAYYLPFVDGTWRAVIYVGAESVAVVSVFAGMRIYRPARPTSWALIGLAMLAVTLGDVAWYWIDFVGGATSPSVADVLYMAEYPLFMAGLVLFARGRPARFVWLDTIIITTGLTVIVWELIVRPTLGDTTASTPEIAIAVAYPLADIAILAAVAGLALSSGLRSVALRLLALGFLLTFGADLASMWLSLAGVELDPSPLDAAWLASAFLLAAAALHPSARVEQTRIATDWLGARTPRLLILFGAALVVPGSLAVETLANAPQDLPVTLAAWVILVVILALRMEEILGRVRRSQQRFQTVFEGSPAGIGLARGNQILDANEAVRSMFRHAEREAFTAQPLTRYVAPSHRADIVERVRARASGSPYDGPFETVGLRVDGTEFPLIVDTRQIELADGPALVGFFADVSERRAADQTLRESERRYRQLFDANPHVMWVYDLETLRFVAVNDMAVEQYGWSRSEFLEMTIADVRPPEDVPALLENVASSDRTVQASGPWRHRLRDGTIRLVDITSHAIEWAGRPARLVLVTDQTARLRLEEQLRQSQKMEAIGRLAGGVAHDFNNLLTAITGNAQLLRDSLDTSDSRSSDVTEILDASDRASALTRQLLAFSRRQVLQPEVISLNETVRGLQQMLGRLIGEDIELRSHLAPDLGFVRADPGQVTQVILNLALNARDAMPSGGTLLLETADVMLDETYANNHAGVSAGPHVMLAVTDTGVGMDYETRQHLFEPFFTTKSVGRGTGLGLATVYGIVKQSGGSIWVYSEPGHGTSFKLYLPRVSDGAPKAVVRGQFDPGDGRETILVVEDETAVRRLVTTVLARHGYRVLEAGRSADGLAVAAAFGGPIHLLITDVIMPGGNGADLAVQFAAVRPGARILFMSGYTQDAIVHHGVLDDGIAFLEKPFSPDALLVRVRSVLGATSRV